MTAQVIFFPLKFAQSQEKLRQLAIAQEQLELAHIELRYAYRFQHISQYRLAKLRYHHGFRNRWKVISNEQILQLSYNDLDNGPEAS